MIFMETSAKTNSNVNGACVLHASRDAKTKRWRRLAELFFEVARRLAMTTPAVSHASGIKALNDLPVNEKSSSCCA